MECSSFPRKKIFQTSVIQRLILKKVLSGRAEGEYYVFFPLNSPQVCMCKLPTYPQVYGCDLGWIWVVYLKKENGIATEKGEGRGYLFEPTQVLFCCFQCVFAVRTWSKQLTNASFRSVIVATVSVQQQFWPKGRTMFYFISCYISLLPWIIGPRLESKFERATFSPSFVFRLGKEKGFVTHAFSVLESPHTAV